jgi:hypothetical protein
VSSNVSECLAFDADREHVGEVVRDLSTRRVVGDHVVVERRSHEREELCAPDLEERLAHDDQDVLPGQRRLPEGRLRGLVLLLVGGGEIRGEVALTAAVVLVHLDVAGSAGAATSVGATATATPTAATAAATAGVIHQDLAGVAAATAPAAGAGPTAFPTALAFGCGGRARHCEHERQDHCRDQK